MSTKVTEADLVLKSFVSQFQISCVDDTRENQIGLCAVSSSHYMSSQLPELHLAKDAVTCAINVLDRNGGEEDQRLSVENDF